MSNIFSVTPSQKKSVKINTPTSFTLGMVSIASLLGSTLIASSASALTLGDFINNPIVVGNQQFTYVASSNIPLTSDIDLSFSGSDYLFNVFFAPSFTGTTFTLDYDVSVLTPYKVISEVDLDSTVPTFRPNEILTTNFNTTQLISNNGSATITDLLGPSAFVSVRNSYVSNGGSISAFQNSFHQENVPEPLTILGTGIALGFGGFFKSKSSKKQSFKA